MLCTPCNYRGWLFCPNFSISKPRIQLRRGIKNNPTSLWRFDRWNYSVMGALKVSETPPSTNLLQNGFSEGSDRRTPLPSNGVLKTSGRFKRVEKNAKLILSSNWSANNGTCIETSQRAKLDKNPVRMEWDSREKLRNYSYMLQTCVLKGRLCDGKAVHGHVIRSGVEPDSHLWTCLVNMYAKCRRFLAARYLLDEMPARDVVSWTALIAGFVSEGNGIEGLNSYHRMRMEGVVPNGYTFATVLKACSMCLTLEFGKQVHGEVIKIGFLSDIYVGSALVDLYAKCSEIALAKSVFLSMPEQNAVSWNALLTGYARAGDSKEVLKLFTAMTESETRLSKYILSSVLKGCASSGNARGGKEIHALLVKIGTELDDFLSSNLVDMYSKCGMAKDANKVFIRIGSPDVVSWSGMIACLDQQGYNYEAANLFNEMRRTGVRPNQFTLASLVSTATALDDLQYGNGIHACIRKLGLQSDTSVSNALVTMYMKIGSTEDGCKVFDGMLEQDLVSWNSLLSGFHDGDTCHQGPKIFNQILVEGHNPNKYTYVSILRSCSSLESICFGKQLHGHVVKNNLANDIYVRTTLVDMYTKCGCLEDAHTVFQGMEAKDVFTWTAIISGYANINQGEKSIKYFRQMQREGVCPNESTLASCIKGCTSIAALENGRQLHSRIIKAGYSDDVFVMSALVDMYGKCGCAEDAEAVFNNLSFRDIVSWNTIICGYSHHGFGERALKAFANMLEEGIAPDEITFTGVLSACSHVGLIEEGKKHFYSMSNIYGVTPTLKHYACMVDMLGRAGKLDEVETLIEEMTYTPDSLIWQTVLGACSRHGNVEFAEKAADRLFELEPQVDSTYILLSNMYAAKGRWDDVAMIRGKMSSLDVKKEPGCSWVEIDGQVHVFLAKDTSHPKVKDIYEKLDEMGLELMSAGYIPDTGNVLHNVSDGEKKESLLYHSERLALAFSLINMQTGKPIRIFKNLRICGDCHNAIKLISDIANREIIIRDNSRFHHFQNGSCSCRDYW